MMNFHNVDNDDRAEWAQDALDTFVCNVGTSGETETDIADLICDLLHLVRKQEGGDPLQAVRNALHHFYAEEHNEARAEVFVEVTKANDDV